MSNPTQFFFAPQDPVAPAIDPYPCPGFMMQEGLVPTSSFITSSLSPLPGSQCIQPLDGPSFLRSVLDFFVSCRCSTRPKSHLLGSPGRKIKSLFTGQPWLPTGAYFEPTCLLGFFGVISQFWLTIMANHSSSPGRVADRLLFKVGDSSAGGGAWMSGWAPLDPPSGALEWG